MGAGAWGGRGRAGGDEWWVTRGVGSQAAERGPGAQRRTLAGKSSGVCVCGATVDRWAGAIARSPSEC
jgi:hypothetical protein